jgi:hypothetical protein
MTTTTIDRKRMDHKSAVAPIQWKGATTGRGRAVIATFGVVDKDGDVTLPGAMPIGKQVVISSYGHSSWQDALPIGKGTIGADQREAWVDFELFLNTPQGSAHYETLKALGELCEWSYGFTITDASFEPELLERYGKGARRLILRVDVFEASPVLLGAGVNTRTESLKCAGCGAGSSLDAGTRAELEKIFFANLKRQNDLRLDALRKKETDRSLRQRDVLKDLRDAFVTRASTIRHALAVGTAEWVSETEMGWRAAVAREARKHAAWSLGVDEPPMTFFRDDGRSGLNGQTFIDGTTKEIFIRADLDAARMVHIVAHEVAHIASPHASEDRIDAWAAHFTARNPDLARAAAA